MAKKKKKVVDLTLGEFLVLMEKYPERPDIPDDYVKPKPMSMNVLPESESIYRIQELEKEGFDFGIDTDILIKVINGNGFWTNEGCFEKIEECSIDFDYKCFYSIYGMYYFEDYGKVWALTKGELK